MKKKIVVETAKSFGRTFVKGNIPEFNPGRCLKCQHCVNLCKKLGPDALDIVAGVAKVVRPQDCLGCGACLFACPNQAIFLLSMYDPASPPATV